MRLATFQHQGQTRIGAVQNHHLVPLDGIAGDMLSFIELGESALEAARRSLISADEHIPLEQVQLLAPIPRPRKNIFAVGLNYAEHAKESARARGEAVKPPTIFTKAPTTVNAPFGEVIVDPSVSLEVDWEVELAVIIGRSGKQIRKEAALDHVFGFCVLNDISARDMQYASSQYFVGKSVDGYCPLGPWIVTREDLPEFQNLILESRVNGVRKQIGNTSQMLYDVPTIIEYISRGTRLEPGDIIATGTPPGVGHARQPQEFLKPGDVLESEIEGIGLLRNPIVGPK